jgi:hypothetical protein
MDWHSFLHSFGRDTAGKYEWSQFLKPRGQATTGQYEGFAYLGLGALILALYAFAHLLAQPEAAMLASAAILAAVVGGLYRPVCSGAFP